MALSYTMICDKPDRQLLNERKAKRNS